MSRDGLLLGRACLLGGLVSRDNVKGEGEAREWCHGSACRAVIYPGERAMAQVDLDAMQALVQTLESAQFAGLSVPVIGWIVEPIPGWYGWWLRLHYRVWGQWGGHGRPPLLSTRIAVVKERSKP